MSHFLKLFPHIWCSGDFENSHTANNKEAEKSMSDLSLALQYPILAQEYFGNTLMQYTYSLLIVLGTVIGAKILYFIMKKYAQRITAKTETDLDDMLLAALEKPVIFLLFIMGLSASIAPLTLDESVLETFGNLIGILLTLDVAWIVIALLDVVIGKFIVPFTRSSKSKLDDQLLPILKNGLKTIVFVLAVLTIISNFGYDITAVLGGLGIAGIAVAMAAQDTIGNILGSLAIFSDRPFEVEDSVRIGSDLGIVEEVGMRSTRIRTLDGTLLTIPNSAVAKSAIENFTKSSKRRVRVSLSLEYGISSKKLSRAKEVLQEIINDTRGIDPDSFGAHFSGFGDSWITLTLTYHIAETSRFLDIQDNVNTRIKERFEKEKIEFAYPSRTLYVKD